MTCVSTAYLEGIRQPGLVIMIDHAINTPSMAWISIEQPDTEARHDI